MTRVLVCGEGGHDIGSKPPDAEDGWLQPVLRKLIGDDVEVVTVLRQELAIYGRERRALQPLPRGHGAKALLCKLRANLLNCDIVVFMADADSNQRSVWREKRQDILHGFSREPRVEGVACVPMSASESWLLADADAWRQIGLYDTSSLPRRPESIWGKRRNPQSNHPHPFFQRMCIKADVQDSRATRVLLAVYSKLDVWRARCPISFGQFANDAQAVLG